MSQAALRFVFIVGCCLLSVAGVQAAPILLLDDAGHLAGINDALINGTTYDVAFSGGTCTEAFGACDGFLFPTLADAVGANTFLNNLIVAEFQADRDPDRNQFSRDVPTIIMTPFRLDGNMVESAATVWGVIPDAEYPWLWGANTSAASFAAQDSTAASGVYAVWTPVPEPSTLVLLGLGFVGVLAAKVRWRFHEWKTPPDVA